MNDLVMQTIMLALEARILSGHVVISDPGTVFPLPRIFTEHQRYSNLNTEKRLGNAQL